MVLHMEKNPSVVEGTRDLTGRKFLGGAPKFPLLHQILGTEEKWECDPDFISSSKKRW